jgi:hypothetical protein
VEAELFSYEKGAFTGRLGRRVIAATNIVPDRVARATQDGRLARAEGLDTTLAPSLANSTDRLRVEARAGRQSSKTWRTRSFA